MKTYVLYLYCELNGEPLFSGEHARGDYETKQKAIADLESKARKLQDMYDKINVTIGEGTEVVYITSIY